MSSAVNVAFVVEGQTDFVVLRAVVRALLNGRDFESNVLQPELSESLLAQGHGGWGGVYRWCRQAVDQANGSLRQNPLLDLYDVVILQIDADVKDYSYADYEIEDPPTDLPFKFKQPCPPARATTDALRLVMLGWLNEITIPPRTILCTPSQTIETWVLAALAPNDFTKKKPIECQRGIEMKLRKHGLITSSQKLVAKYAEREKEIGVAWPQVREKCAEAERFSQEFREQIPSK